MMKKLTLLFVILFCCTNIFAQQPPPFFEDIQKFKIKDLDSMPPKNAILFVGSSSFTKWTDVQEYFPKHTIINRGFGGSTLQDVTYYAEQIILPYHAKQIVIYCGENDLAYSAETAPEDVLERFQELFKIIRNNNSSVPVAFISIKPSPSRQHLWPKMKKANQLIKKFLAENKKTSFINVWPLMFNKDGSIMKDIFIEDNLHMNAKGYHIWQKAIAPYLIK